MEKQKIKVVIVKFKYFKIRANHGHVLSPTLGDPALKFHTYVTFLLNHVDLPILKLRKFSLKRHNISGFNCVQLSGYPILYLNLLVASVAFNST